MFRYVRVHWTLRQRQLSLLDHSSVRTSSVDPGNLLASASYLYSGLTTGSVLLPVADGSRFKSLVNA